jgi:MFS family permease
MITDESRSYGPIYRWYLLAVGILVVSVSSMDRQVLALLAEPIRRDLHVTDFQISLLGGLAFGLFYAVCAVPIGRLIDSGKRPLILACGILLWSAATFGSGLATTYAMLFTLRVLVAVGEASASPCTLGMVTDVFLGPMLGRTVVFVMLGAALGGSLATIGGGYLIGLMKGMDVVALPFGLALKPWQVVFLAAGVPGLVLGPLILLTIRDPVRRRVVLDAQGKNVRVSFRGLWNFIAQNKGAVGAHAFGYSIWSIGDKSLSFWGPTYLIRSYELPVSTAGILFGAISVATVLGHLVCGWLVDRATKAGHRDSAMRIGRNAAACAVVPILLFPFMPTLTLSMAVLVIGLFCASGYSTVTIAQQQFAPNQVRAQYTALYLLISNIIGAVIGVSLVAIVTEWLFHDRAMIGYSIAIVCGIATAIGALILAWGIKPYDESMRRIDRETAPATVAAE